MRKPSGLQILNRRKQRQQRIRGVGRPRCDSAKPRRDRELFEDVSRLMLPGANSAELRLVPPLPPFPPVQNGVASPAAMDPTRNPRERLPFLAANGTREVGRTSACARTREAESAAVGPEPLPNPGVEKQGKVQTGLEEVAHVSNRIAIRRCFLGPFRRQHAGAAGLDSLGTTLAGGGRAERVDVWQCLPASTMRIRTARSALRVSAWKGEVPGVGSQRGRRFDVGRLRGSGPWWRIRKDDGESHRPGRRCGPQWHRHRRRMETVSGVALRKRTGLD